MFHHNKMRRFLAKLQFRRSGIFFFHDLALPLPVNFAKTPHRCFWSKPWENFGGLLFKKERWTTLMRIWQLTEIRQRRVLPVLKWRVPVQHNWLSGACGSRWSYECWKLYSWSRNGLHTSQWVCTWVDIEIPCHTLRGVGEMVASLVFRK